MTTSVYLQIIVRVSLATTITFLSSVENLDNLPQWAHDTKSSTA